MDSYAQMSLSIVSLMGSQFGNTSEECLSGAFNPLGCGWLAPCSLGGIDVGNLKFADTTVGIWPKKIEV